MKKSTLTFLIGAVVVFFGYRWYKKNKAAQEAASQSEVPGASISIGGGGGGGGSLETASTTSNTSIDTSGKIIVAESTNLVLPGKETTSTLPPPPGSYQNTSQPQITQSPTPALTTQSAPTILIGSYRGGYVSAGMDVLFSGDHVEGYLIDGLSFKITKIYGNPAYNGNITVKATDVSY